MKAKVIKIKHVSSPIGDLQLGAYDGRLCMLDFRYRKMRQTIDNRIQKMIIRPYHASDRDDLVTLWQNCGLRNTR